MKNSDAILRKPSWLKIKKIPKAQHYSYLKELLNKGNIHTICESGNCPNIGECWNAKTATFMILGEICTRSCQFCGVTKGVPLPIDYNEPDKIVKVVSELNLKHCVLTSVTRDDIPDGGAEIWSKVINLLKQIQSPPKIEALIPDFNGNFNALLKVIESKPDIISHNLETTKQLSPIIRKKAKYSLSLNLLNEISKNKIVSKSGIMLGLGETKYDVLQVMDDLLNVNCKIMTIGQYLQPAKNNIPVSRYVPPEEFEEYKTIGLQKGFKFIESAPFVRSSYHAAKHIIA